MKGLNPMIQVKEIMNRQVRVIPGALELKEALERMKTHNTGILLVKQDQHVGGILSAKDVLMRNGINKNRLGELKVRDVMDPDVRFIYEDQPVQLVRTIMEAKNLNYLVVLNRGNKITGICTRRNLHSIQ